MEMYALISPRTTVILDLRKSATIIPRGSDPARVSMNIPNVQLCTEEDMRKLGLPEVLDTAYYTIYGNDEYVLVIMKRYDKG